MGLLKTSRLAAEPVAGISGGDPEAGNEAELSGVRQSMTITMYGADWCGDCRRAKAYLAERGVPYTYVDLIEQPEATDIVIERNGGAKSIPVVVFADDSHLTEPTNAELEQKLGALAPRTSMVVERRDGEGAGRFELRLDGKLLSFASFIEAGDVVTVPHVETFPEHRGNGNAAALMDGLLGLLRSSGRRIAPLCPFAAAHVQSDERNHDLLV